MNRPRPSIHATKASSTPRSRRLRRSSWRRRRSLACVVMLNADTNEHQYGKNGEDENQDPTLRHRDHASTAVLLGLWLFLGAPDDSAAQHGFAGHLRGLRN